MGIIAKARDMYRGRKIGWTKSTFYDKSTTDKYPQVCIMGALGIALHNGINIVEKDEEVVRGFAHEFDNDDGGFNYEPGRREQQEILTLHKVLNEKYGERDEYGDRVVYFHDDPDLQTAVQDIIEWNDGTCENLEELLTVLDLTYKRIAAAPV